MYFIVFSGAMTLSIRNLSKMAPSMKDPWVTRHHDTQFNDIQHKDTQHKGLICDTKHNCYAECKGTKVTLSINDTYHDSTVTSNSMVETGNTN
jgi:hypothetical protein